MCGVSQAEQVDRRAGFRFAGVARHRHAFLAVCRLKELSKAAFIIVGSHDGGLMMSRRQVDVAFFVSELLFADADYCDRAGRCLKRQLRCQPRILYQQIYAWTTEGNAQWTPSVAVSPFRGALGHAVRYLSAFVATEGPGHPAACPCVSHNMYRLTVADRLPDKCKPHNTWGQLYEDL